MQKLFAHFCDLYMTICCGRHSYYSASSTDGGLGVGESHPPFSFQEVVWETALWYWIMLTKTDLCKMKKVKIDIEGMGITAQGGCQAIDLDTPL